MCIQFKWWWRYIVAQFQCVSPIHGRKLHQMDHLTFGPPFSNSAISHALLNSNALCHCVWKCEISYCTNFSLSLVPVDDIMKHVFRLDTARHIFIFTFVGFSQFLSLVHFAGLGQALEWKVQWIWTYFVMVIIFAEANENTRAKQIDRRRLCCCCCCVFIGVHKLHWIS